MFNSKQIIVFLAALVAVIVLANAEDLPGKTGDGTLSQNFGSYDFIEEGIPPYAHKKEALCSQAKSEESCHKCCQTHSKVGSYSTNLSLSRVIHLRAKRCECISHLNN